MRKALVTVNSPADALEVMAVAVGDDTAKSTLAATEKKWEANEFTRVLSVVIDGWQVACAAFGTDYITGYDVELIRHV